ncbi:hypothetical protein JCM8547_007235 [Rhodosporidiobolus lusitaniae]
MLDRIPPELLEKVLRDECVTLVDLASCCLVSKAVLIVARAELYKSLELHIGLDEADCVEGTQYIKSSAPPLEALQLPHIGSLVHDFRVVAATDGASATTLKTALKDLASSLTNVRSLHFDQYSGHLLPLFARAFPSLREVKGATLTTETWEASLVLPHLEGLGCEMPHPEEDLAALEKTQLPSPPSLRAFSIKGHQGSPAVLRTLLRRSVSTLHTVRLPAPFLPLLGPLDAFSSLRTLFLDFPYGSDASSISHALSQITSIHTLVFATIVKSRFDRTGTSSLIRDARFADTLHPQLERLVFVGPIARRDAIATIPRLIETLPKLKVFSAPEDTVNLEIIKKWRHVLHTELAPVNAIFEDIEGEDLSSIDPSWLEESKLLKVLRRMPSHQAFSGDVYNLRERGNQLFASLSSLSIAGGNRTSVGGMKAICEENGLRWTEPGKDVWDYC